MIKKLLPWIGVGARLLVLAIPVAAQQPADSPQEIPLVFVDALVLDPENRIVTGIRADELVIFEDEVAHQVVRLEAAAESTEPIHLVVVALVGEPPSADAVAALVQALGRLGPGLQVCIFRLGSDLRLLHPFSGQSEGLLQALRSSEPGQLPEAGFGRQDERLDSRSLATAQGRLQLARRIQRIFYATSADLRRSSRSSYPALIQAVARALSGIQGRKSLLLLGPDQVSPPLPPSEVERTLELANAFHLAVYSQDEARPEPSPGAQGRDVAPLRRSGRSSPLRLIVNSTSGFVLGQDDLASQIRRVFLEARNHYRLFYHSRQPVLDGRYRKQRLAVARLNLEARNRTGYPARPKGMELLGHSELEALDTIQKAHQSGSGEAFLRADVLQKKALGQKVLVSLTIPSSSLQFRDLTAQGREGRICRIQINALLRDESGAVLQTFGGPLALRLNDSRNAVVEQNGLAVNRLISLAPGHYSLQAGFLDELGGSGSWLTHDFQVRPPATELAWSPILLGRRDRISIRGRDAAPLGTGNFVPSARRTFRAEGRLAFVAEAYNLEESSQADIQAYLENVLGARSSLKLERDEGRAGLAQGSLDLSELAAGKYQLVVEAVDVSSGALAQSRAPFEVVGSER